MKRFVRFQLLVGLILSWTASSAQLPDTTELWTAPTWKVRKLMQIALRAQACDSLVKSQDDYIKNGLAYEAAQDSVLRLRSMMIVNLEHDNQDWKDRFENEQAMTKIQKKKKRKWVWISAGATALLIFTNIP